MQAGRNRSSRSTWVTLAFILLVLTAPTRAQDYRGDLGTNLGLASDYLSEASDAIAECNEDLLGCIRDPEATADRIDNATAGLEGVVSNLSLLDPPAEHQANHNLLLQGFDKIVAGFSLYSQALRDREPTSLIDGLELIQEGKEEVNTATSSILGDQNLPVDIVLVVTLGVVGAAVAMFIVLALLLLRLRQNHLDAIHRNLATCPVCDEILDKWWTFRMSQIREWQQNHLKGHRQERESSLPSGSQR